MHELTPTEERDRQDFFNRLYGSGPDVSKISLGPIDNGFHRISQATALELCDNKLPRWGYFIAIVYDGYRCEIHRTPVNKEMVWAIMITNHRER